MIEIIREETSGGTTERRSLPKDIKQMGKPDIGDRIYVEDEVYQFLHPYSNVEEKCAYVLLGRFENFDGRACVFVEAAIYLEEIAFEGDLPLWNDQTWAYIYRQLRHEFDKMVIVGWAMDIKGQLPNMTVRVEQLHQSHFGGEHQVLFLMDSLEREEAFYGNRNGHLYRREGFYVYYEKKAIVDEKKEIRRERELHDKNEAHGKSEMYVEQMACNQSEIVGENRAFWDWKHVETDDDEPLVARGSYRKQMEEKSERQRIPSYVSTLLLATAVCVFGIMAYFNGEKMKMLETALTQMNQAPVIETQTLEPEVAVENVEGNVQEKDTEKMGQESEPIPEPAALAPETTTLAPETTVPATEPVTPASEVENAAPEGAVPGIVEQPAAEQPAAAQTAEPTAQTAEATATMVEAQTYLNQGYYIVQKGDSLVGICKKVYQTTAMMDKLCEVNGIENPDAIYAGQKLILPN